LQTLTVSATSGHVLKVSAGGVPVWAAETGGSGGSGGQWAIVNTNDIHYSSGNVGIGTNNPGAELHISGTGAVIVPNGTTAERPATVVNGMMRYNSTTGFMEAYTAQGWGGLSGDQSSTISGISPASVLLANTGTQVFTVTGGGFTTGSTVQLVGANGTEYTVFDTTIVSASQITFKMGVDGATGGYDKAQRPYTVKVTGQDFNVTQSSATIGFGGLSWTLPAANATLNYTSGTASTENLTATDEIGGSAVTFSIVSGTLNGLTLGSATASPATFGGSATGAATNSILFRITDNVSGATADRTFSIEVIQPPSVSGISPASVLLANTGTQVFTVTGGGFTSGSTVQLVGADGTVYSVFDTTIVSATQMTFKMGVDGATGGYDKAQRPYTLKVTANSGLATQSSATIGFGGLSWTSPAASTTFEYVEGTTTTENLVATDDLGGSDVTFSIVSGTLNGLTLGSATASPATFGGSATGAASTWPSSEAVVFRITDTVSGATADRTVTIEVTTSAPPTGEATFTTTGHVSTTSTWVAPTGVTSVSLVCVGGGGAGGYMRGSGGAGGGLAYKNNITTVPGNSYTVTVGRGGLRLYGTGSSSNHVAGARSSSNGVTSSFSGTGITTISATGGQHGCGPINITTSGQPVGGSQSGSYDGGGTGGTSEGSYSYVSGADYELSSGGGGAGGYDGTGGTGAGSEDTDSAYWNSATAGANGGGGGGGVRNVKTFDASTYAGAGGGGVGLSGRGTNGTAGANYSSTSYNTQTNANNGGGGGSGGGRGNVSTVYKNGGDGGTYGGGGGPGVGKYQNTSAALPYSGYGGDGAVRIIWGTGRSFPTNAS
jgi:hypothetical protein